MGKDLRGKELGVGISQRKDGLYTARFTKRDGRRIQKYFNKLADCKNWIAEETYKDKHGSLEALEDLVTDAWFDYWITQVKESNIRETTKKRYRSHYKNHISPVIGKMLVSEVRPIHCQMLLNKMAKDKKNSTIRNVRMLLFSIFESAMDNQIILNNPVNGNVKCTTGKSSEKKEALTLEEQNALLCATEVSRYKNQYQFILQTGLRTGEMIALKWSDVDMKNRLLHITKTMDAQHPNKRWRVGEPKSKSGIRDIPLTDEAVRILMDQKEKNKKIAVIPMEYADYIFLNHKGQPVSNEAYNCALLRVCKKAKIRDISMHILRHSFATRCIEAGMKPKVLQRILGHATLSMTMDLYVSVTEEELQKEVAEVQNHLKVV